MRRMRRCSPTGTTPRSGLDEDWVWWGVMAHACRYLTVSAGIRRHESADVYLKFYVDGTARLTLRVGDYGSRWVTVSPGAEAAYTEVDTGEPNYTPFNGETIFFVTADMAGWGLSLGDEYQIQVKLSWGETGEEGVRTSGRRCIICSRRRKVHRRWPAIRSRRSGRMRIMSTAIRRRSRWIRCGRISRRWRRRR